MIWIIGGTSETRQLLGKIRGQVDYIITVATESGKDVLPETEPVLVGRMDVGQMRQFLQDHDIDTVVDLTHPYAAEVTQNASLVCRESQVCYLRYVRETSSDTKGAVFVSSVEECVTFLRAISGCVFFTTGSKHIADFQKARGKNRFVYRVLPTIPSLEACHEQQIDIKDIVAVVGPFSTMLNMAMFQEYLADYVIMKDSGTIGGTPEKIKACHQLGITPVIIDRTQEEGIENVDKLAELLKNAARSRAI